MKKILLFLFLILLVSGTVKAQNWTEGFEGNDSLSLPSGWSVYNRAGYPIAPFTNWTVRDTGKVLPGVNPIRRSRAYSGLKAIGVSWWSGVDTTTGNDSISDAWLVTKRIRVWSNSAFMSYWLAGGTPTLKDSLQIWVSTVDSTPQSFTHYIETLVMGPGTWGLFGQNIVDLSPYVGQTVWVGFRYKMDVSVDGVFMHIDNVETNNPIGIQQISSEVPQRFELKQNYPNPFNPVTNIEFSIAKTRDVNLVIYNSLGQLVATLVNQELKPGIYKYDFNASGLPSGSYYYRLTAGDFVRTNKMILVK